MKKNIREIFISVALVAFLLPSAIQAQSLFVNNGSAIYEITPNGVITNTITLPGVAGAAGGLVFDKYGNMLAASFFNNAIYKIALDDTISLFTTNVIYPAGLAFDKAGNLFVASPYTQLISEVTPTGTVSTFDSQPGSPEPYAVAFDSYGHLFVADWVGGYILEYQTNGTSTTFATGLDPVGLAFDVQGNLYASALYGGKIYKFAPDGTGTVFASVPFPAGLAFDSAGNLYAGTYYGSGNVYKITPDGTTTVFANVPVYGPGQGGLIGLAFQPSQAFLTNGLVAYYPLNGNAIDASGNGNDGVVVGAVPATDRFGNMNGCYSFNGDSQYIYAAADKLPSGPRTISIWFNANEVDTRPQCLGYGGNSCGNSFFEGLNTAGGGGFEVSTHCDVYSLSVPYLVSPTNAWYHWVVTMDDVGMSFYVNGQMVGSRAGTSATSVAGTQLGLGVISSPIGIVPYTDGNVGYFNGYLDDVRIYSRALSTSEVQQLYAWESGSSNGPPSIMDQPQSITVFAGANVNFGVSASGSPPLFYQWLFNQTNLLTGRTNSTLTITNVTTDSVGLYSVVITNTFGAVTSVLASLTISNLPDLAPVSVTAPASATWGSSIAVLSVITNDGLGTASGYWADGIYLSASAVFDTNAIVLGYTFQNHTLPASSSYAWTNTLALPTVQPGSYYLFVQAADPNYAGGAYPVYEVTRTNNVYGPVAFSVIPGPPPTITALNPTQGLTNGGTAVSINGSGFESGAVVSFGGQLAGGAFVNSGQITAVTPPGPLGPADVALVNPDGNSVTATNGFVYTGPPPMITSQPPNATLPQGSNAVFQVGALYASGYQWQFNGGNLTDNGRITGTHTSTLSIANAQPTDAGNYKVLLTNIYGSTTSAPAVLSVIVPPRIVIPPQNQFIGMGGTAVFTVGVTGTAPFAYQWLEGGTPLPGATNGSLQILNVQPSNQGQYSVVVSNAAGTATSASAGLTVLNYCAGAQVAQAIYPVGTAVPISLTTFSCLPQTAVPNSSATVWISTTGTTRSLQATTGPSGATTVNFRPLATEAGVYQVAAALPGQAIPPAQGAFYLVGMGLSRNRLNVQLTPGVSVTNTIILTNLTSVDLTGINASVDGAAPDVQVQLSTPGTLSGRSMNLLTCIVSARSDLAAIDQFNLRITSAQGTVNWVGVAATVVPLTPQLEVTPAMLQASMVAGGQTLVNFTVANSGGTTSGPVEVLLPQVPWLTLVTPQPLPPLAPGQSNQVTLALTPAPNLALGPYTGSLELTSSNAYAGVRFEFDCVSTLVGSLSVTVQDELTYYATNSPNVSNATVTVIDFLSGSNVASAVTDASGMVLFSNLTSAYYTVAVGASDHDSYRATLLVAANTTNDLVAFLPLHLVTYTWIVTPTQYPDHYQFTLDTTFATEVPWPVVTVDPGYIDLCTLQGQSNQINLTFTNTGLISAQGLNLYFGPHPDWLIQPLATDLGDLAPHTSLVVPVTITQIGSALDVPEFITAQFSYHVTTPDSTNYSILPIFVFDANPLDCDPTRPTPLPTNSICVTCGGPSDTNGLIIIQPPPGVGSTNPQSVLVEIVLEIQQSAVIARDAFNATLRLSNNAGATVSNLDVTLTVYDVSNNVANNLFGFPPPLLYGLNAVDGTGILEDGASGQATWTIIPATNAAPQAPTSFKVGGSFSYILNGETIIIPLFPVPITVLPTPILDVDYFLQHDVYSDDPFTPQIEPSIPFPLGMLVRNVGYGNALDFTITSAQPRIIQNSNDLLIAFQIIGSQVGTNQSLSPSLTMDFGNIGPQGTADGLWYMTSTLEGQFITFAASFAHTDDLGNTNTSLINRVAIHEMNHVVRMTSPDDGLPDFLVNDTTNVDALPGIVYSSDGTTYPVTSITSAVTIGSPSPMNSNITLTVSAPSGWVYLEVVDPGGGTYPISGVKRSDDVSLLVGPNVWQTPRRIHMVPPQTNTLIHIFDYNSTGTYTITYGQPITAPTAITLDAVNVTATNATLNALVTPNGANTDVYFQWGTTTNYMNTALAATLTASLNTAQAVAWAVGGLRPASTNYFRVMAFNSAGTNYGSDSIFMIPPLPPPVITPVANQFLVIGGTLIITNTAQVATPPVIWSRDNADPTGVFIDPVKGVLTWTPTCAQGSSTNLITVWATDSSSPPLSNSMSFWVTNSDCVQVGLGSTVMLTGTTSSVPLTLISSLALTNLSFDVFYPSGRFTNWTVSLSNNAIGTAIVQTVGSAKTLFTFEASPGQSFQSPAGIGALSFTALLGHSGLIPLGVTNVQAAEVNGASAGNAFGENGRVVVIGFEPLLEAGLGTNAARIITLYGHVGSTIELMSNTALSGTSWQAGPSLTMTNLTEQLIIPSGGKIFYRAIQVQ